MPLNPTNQQVHAYIYIHIYVCMYSIAHVYYFTKSCFSPNMLLFLVGYHTSKVDIIKYYLLQKTPQYWNSVTKNMYIQ